MIFLSPRLDISCVPVITSRCSEETVSTLELTYDIYCLIL